ncbi:MAG: anti-sigma regulatory factor [Spirulinaceae cyanobacterium RM2_2_10]|nr:anti-sigma regulatory factor [Spirulinaceae cyanobacterium SM2_1_0]NJO18921.1 anti-sigma regulatory factor [Spirulinaceae cyanobacterium RM2_2_10]
MIAISLPAPRRSWETLSFASTLYLCPVLELLMAHVPSEWEVEVRLGLQEALVNAAKHGNKLDPSKTISVQFSMTDGLYSWVILDQGTGFTPQPDCCGDESETLIPPEDWERGRGLCILHQVFDQVHWNRRGTELHLCKYKKR